MQVIAGGQPSGQARALVVDHAAVFGMLINKPVVPIPVLDNGVEPTNTNIIQS